MGYLEDHTANQKKKEVFKDHPAFHKCYWNCSFEEMEGFIKLWDKIASYGVPADLINELVNEGVSIGMDEQSFNDGENDD